MWIYINKMLNGISYLFFVSVNKKNVSALKEL